MPNINEQEFINFENQPLNMDELCKFLRAKKSTMYEYCRQGMPRFYVGKEARFIPDKVIVWLEERSLDRIYPDRKHRSRP